MVSLAVLIIFLVIAALSFALLIKPEEVEEGKVKLIEAFGQFSKILVGTTGFGSDDSGNIVSGGKSYRILMGIFFAGYRGIHKSRMIEEIKDGSEIIFHQEKPPVAEIERADSISLKRKSVTLKIMDIETLDNFNMEVSVVVYSRLLNPMVFYKVGSPEMNCYQNLVSEIRDIFWEKTVAEITSAKGSLDEDFFKALTDRKVIKKILSELSYSVEGLEFIQVDPPEEYRQAMAAPELARKNAEALVAKAKGEKDSAILVAEGKKQAAILESQGDLEASENRSEAERKTVKMLKQEFGPEGALAAHQTMALSVSSLVVALRSDHIHGIGKEGLKLTDIASDLKKEPK